MIGKTTRKRLLEVANKSTLLASQAELIVRTLLKERQAMQDAVDDFIFAARYNTNDFESTIKKIYDLREAQEKE